MVESWKEIKGFSGKYSVSNTGKIMSHITNKILKPTFSNTGYTHVQLYNDSGSKVLLIHRIVAEAFIDNPENKPEVNHIDGIKSHNSVDNLEWVTTIENYQHAIRIGLRKASKKPPKKPKQAKTDIIDTNQHLQRRQIAQYTYLGDLVKVWPSVSEAARQLGACSTSISSCLTGRYKTSSGYLWKYVDEEEIPDKIQAIEICKSKNSKHEYVPKTNRGKYLHAHRKIQQLDKNGNLIRTWNGCNEILAETDFHITHIYKCASGIRKTTGGYMWRYVD